MRCFVVRRRIAVAIAALFSAFTASGTYAADHVLILYQVGRAAVFTAGDVTDISSHEERDGRDLVMRIDITNAMSARLGVFTEAIVGERIINVMLDDITSDNTLVRDSILGTTLHVYGQNDGAFRDLVAWMVDARQRSNGNGALIRSYERKAKIPVAWGDIKACKIGDRSVVIGLGPAVLKRANPDGGDAASKSWIVAAREKLVADRKQASLDGDGVLTVNDIAPEALGPDFAQRCN